MTNDEIWTCKDGRRIRVDDMEESHVRAALNMVIRNSRKRALLARTVVILEKAEREMMNERKGIGHDQ